MSSAPTQSESVKDATWRASKPISYSVRIVVFLLPLLAGWTMVRLVAGELYRPAGGWGTLVWAVQAFAVGFVVAQAVERWSRRILPLSTLYGLSLVFPDEAPSRFSTALRLGSSKKLGQQLEQLGSASIEAQTVQESAELALGLVALLGQHDRRTRGHSERVRAYADLIAEQLELPERDRNMLSWATLLHDVGKLSVPAEILNSATRPTEEEWKTLALHPGAGEHYLEPLSGWLGEWLGAATEHHERWDGAGYPRKLAGTQISLAGRITAVADAYDTMTSVRSYKSAFTREAARRELVACSGTQFDPEVVRAFLNVSLGRSWMGGRFTWVTELPGLWANGLNALPAATMSVAVSAVAVTGLAVPAFGLMPEELALVTDATEIDAASTTTTVGPSSTTTPSQNSTTTSPGDTLLDPSTTIAGEPPGTNSTTTSVNRSTTTQPTGTTILGATTAPTTPGVSTTTLPTLPTTTLPVTTTTLPVTTTTSPPLPPIAVADAYVVNQAKMAELAVLGNDVQGGLPWDFSTLRFSTAPAHAQSWSVNRSNNRLRYQSDALYLGADQFRYEICNSAGQCTSALVVLTVVPGL